MTTETLHQFAPGNVKAAMKGLSSGDLWKVPRPCLHVEPGFNVRVHDKDYDAHVRAIADSMKENGYYSDKPLAGFVAEDNRIIITDGHTRLAAYDLAESEGMPAFDLPVVTKPRGTSMEDLTVALVTSNSGKPLSPYELGLVCKRLVGYGMDPKDIAKRLSFTDVYVNSLLDLAAAPKAVRDLVVEGTVSATLAIDAIKQHGKDAAKVLTAGVKEAKASGKERATAKHVKAATEKKAKKGKKSNVSPEQAAQMEAVLKKGAKWWITEQGGAANLRSVLIAYTATITGLPVSDIEPYFEDEM